MQAGITDEQQQQQVMAAAAGSLAMAAAATAPAPRAKRTPAPAGKWTKEEDAMLRKIVGDNGAKVSCRVQNLTSLMSCATYLHCHMIAAN